MLSSPGSIAMACIHLLCDMFHLRDAIFAIEMKPTSEQCMCLLVLSIFFNNLLWTDASVGKLLMAGYGIVHK